MSSYNKRKKIFSQSDSNENISFLSLLKKCIVFSVIFFLVFFLITAIIGVLFYNTENPTPKADFVGIISLFLASIICSFALSRTLNERNILSGLIMGLFVLGIILIISAIIPGSRDGNNIIVLRYFTPIICIFGSIIGMKRKNKKRRHKHYN